MPKTSCASPLQGQEHQFKAAWGLVSRVMSGINACGLAYGESTRKKATLNRE